MKNSDISFGIVQGRLTKSRKLQQFPKDWKNEFRLIKKTKLKFIELLDERELNSLNPLTYKGGFDDIDQIIKKNKLIKYSICTDYIINNNLFSQQNTKIFKHVERLLELSVKYKYKIFVLPLLEASTINKKNWRYAIKILKKFSNMVKNSSLVICLETILNTKDLIKILKDINKKNVRCVFDTGNRVLISNSLKNEILKLNKYIGHVHIKDKNNKNINVVLGTGQVNFAEIFKSLKQINYKGKFTFETNRGTNPLSTAIYNDYYCNFLNNL